MGRARVGACRSRSRCDESEIYRFLRLCSVGGSGGSLVAVAGACEEDDEDEEEGLSSRGLGKSSHVTGSPSAFLAAPTCSDDNDGLSPDCWMTAVRNFASCRLLCRTAGAMCVVRVPEMVRSL